MRVFPHLMGSPVNIAAYAQYSASIPNYVLQDADRIDDHPMNEIVDQPLVFEAGYVIVPDRPGIGVEIREEKLAKFPAERVKTVGDFRPDGSMAH